MKAAIFTEVGKYPKVTQSESPNVKEDHLIVDIAAAALNHRDLWISKGMYPGIDVPCILGSDGVGYIDGRRVIVNPGMNWGDNKAVQDADFSILGMPDNGTFAEQILVPESNVYDVPEHLGDFEAAALPLAGVTAYRALVNKCGPRKGETVLITGIGGGVALFALQYAVAIGCKVFVSSSSPDKIEKAKALGAEDGILYTDQDWHKQLMSISGGIDVVIDSAGGSGFAKFPIICNPGGRISFYGGTRGKIDGLSPQIIFWKQLSIYGSTMGSDHDFQDMLNFVSRHKIIPVVDRVFKFNEVNLAFEKMDKGKQFGKLVLNINTST